MEEKTQHEIEFDKLIDQYSGAKIFIKEVHINTNKIPKNYFVVDDGLFVAMNGNVFDICGVMVVYQNGKFITSDQEVEFTWEGIKHLFDVSRNDSWIYA